MTFSEKIKRDIDQHPVRAAFVLALLIILACVNPSMAGFCALLGLVALWPEDEQEEAK